MKCPICGYDMTELEDGSQECYNCFYVNLRKRVSSNDKEM